MDLQTLSLFPISMLPLQFPAILECPLHVPCPISTTIGLAYMYRNQPPSGVKRHATLTLRYPKQINKSINQSSPSRQSNAPCCTATVEKKEKIPHSHRDPHPPSPIPLVNAAQLRFPSGVFEDAWYRLPQEDEGPGAAAGARLLLPVARLLKLLLLSSVMTLRLPLGLSLLLLPPGGSSSITMLDTRRVLLLLQTGCCGTGVCRFFWGFPSGRCLGRGRSGW